MLPPAVEWTSAATGHHNSPRAERVRHGVTGDRAVQFADGGVFFQFRGRRIYDAVINSLLAQHGLVRLSSHRLEARTCMDCEADPCRHRH